MQLSSKSSRLIPLEQWTKSDRCPILEAGNLDPQLQLRGDGNDLIDGLLCIGHTALFNGNVKDLHHNVRVECALVHLTQIKEVLTSPHARIGPNLLIDLGYVPRGAYKVVCSYQEAILFRIHSPCVIDRTFIRVGSVFIGHVDNRRQVDQGGLKGLIDLGEGRNSPVKKRRGSRQLKAGPVRIPSRDLCLFA